MVIAIAMIAARNLMNAQRNARAFGLSSNRPVVANWTSANQTTRVSDLSSKWTSANRNAHAFHLSQNSNWLEFANQYAQAFGVSSIVAILKMTMMMEPKHW